VVNLLSPGQGILANQTLPNIGQGCVLDVFNAADGDELFHLACLGHTIKQVDIEHGLAVGFVCLTHWLMFGKLMLLKWQRASLTFLRFLNLALYFLQVFLLFGVRFGVRWWLRSSSLSLIFSSRHDGEESSKLN
jgi:hypothetical protein